MRQPPSRHNATSKSMYEFSRDENGLDFREIHRIVGKISGNENKKFVRYNNMAVELHSATEMLGVLKIEASEGRLMKGGMAPEYFVENYGNKPFILTWDKMRAFY